MVGQGELQAAFGLGLDLRLHLGTAIGAGLCRDLGIKDGQEEQDPLLGQLVAGQDLCVACADLLDDMPRGEVIANKGVLELHSAATVLSNLFQPFQQLPGESQIKKGARRAA